VIVVVDLDGTLCDSAHREHLARAKQWDEFHCLLGEDKPNKAVAKLLLTLMNMPEGPVVVGLTGRNERYRLMTLRWLDKHGLALDDLLMRPDDNYQSDHELKPQMLDDWLTAQELTRSDVWFILEDREKVVEAWRNLGHECWQVRAGGY